MGGCETGQSLRGARPNSPDVSISKWKEEWLVRILYAKNRNIETSGGLTA